MRRLRIIPCLLLHNRGLYKTRRFRQPTYVGDPINAVKIFCEKEADELFLVDIDATVRRQQTGGTSDDSRAGPRDSNSGTPHADAPGSANCIGCSRSRCSSAGATCESIECECRRELQLSAADRSDPDPVSVAVGESAGGKSLAGDCFRCRESTQRASRSGNRASRSRRRACWGRVASHCRRRNRASVARRLPSSGPRRDGCSVD